MDASFKLYERVRGASRPRFRRNGQVYEVKADRAYKELIRAAYERENTGVWFGDSPVSVNIVTHRQLPKTALKRIDSEPDTKKPDVDNVAKIVLDALNGVAWDDDRQVVSCLVVKAPRTRNPEHIEVHICEEEQ